MAPVENSARDGEPASEPEVVAVPGQPCTLDGGVPWVRRTEEMSREVARLRSLILEIKAGPFGQGLDAVDGCELHVIGSLKAALWTVGVDSRAPSSGTERQVTGRAIREELALAEQRMLSREEGWQQATGVVFWLLWVTGAEETLSYPGFEGTPATSRHGP